MNYITIHGRLTKDPELRKTQSDVSVCNFTVAVDRRYQSKEEKQTDFFDCVAWRGLADTIHQHFSKGKEIILSGEMQSRKWVDNDGKNRISWEIQVGNFDFCGSKKDSTPGTNYNSAGAVLVEVDEQESGELPF